jgi:hypothetical protein
MANLVFVRSSGRVTEFAERVNGNDPANSVFEVAVLATTGIESDAVLRIKDDFASLVSGTTNYVTNSGYAVKVLDNATGGITVTYDDTNFRTDVDIPDQTWTAVAAGDGWNDVVTGYDPDSTAGTTTDSSVLPMTLHDFVLTPDGSDITAQVAVFFRAQT